MTLRRALAVVLCLLLLTLQSQTLVHPISHIAGKPQDTSLTSSTVDAPCAQCALLAGGGTAVVAAAPISYGNDFVDVVAAGFHPSRTADSPAWFQSRAPPARLV